VTGRTDKGTANVAFAGISGAYERHTALPNKMRMIIDLGVVKIDQGFDGEKGWVDQGQGMQPMPAEQAKEMAEPSADGAAFLDPSRYAKSAVVGKDQQCRSHHHRVFRCEHGAAFGYGDHDPDGRADGHLQGLQGVRQEEGGHHAHPALGAG
jgi:hypothetical protein